VKEIIVVLHNVRSAHNVGSILRTSEGLGVKQVYLSGFTPYPKQARDSRLPHEIKKTNSAISKTALGAEKLLPISHHEDIFKLMFELRSAGYELIALEQSPDSTTLTSAEISNKVALIAGREVEGVEKEVLEAVDMVLEIPMLGAKESYNVSVAVAMALYQIRFMV